MVGANGLVGDEIRSSSRPSSFPGRDALFQKLHKMEPNQWLLTYDPRMRDLVSSNLDLQTISLKGHV